MKLFRRNKKQERKQYNVYYVEFNNILKSPIWSNDKYRTIKVLVYNVNKTITQCRNEAIKEAKKQMLSCEYCKGIVNYFEYN